MPPMQRNVPSGSLLIAQVSEPRRADGTTSSDDGGQRAEHNPNPKGKQRAGQAEPRGKQSHQLGVAQADALAAANEPVEPADEQDEAGGGEDLQEAFNTRRIQNLAIVLGEASAIRTQRGLRMQFLTRFRAR